MNSSRTQELGEMLERAAMTGALVEVMISSAKPLPVNPLNQHSPSRKVQVPMWFSRLEKPHQQMILRGIWIWMMISYRMRKKVRRFSNWTMTKVS
jgi:hypothetical protein